MCSVSFLPHAHRFYLGMNRDESRQRPAANGPKRFRRGERVALYPTEPTGGSWVGVNDLGLTLALINWYAIPHARGTGRVSRGIVVPSLLALRCVEEVPTVLATLPIRDMPAFRLLAFGPRERRVCEFRWDQHALDLIPHPWAPGHWFSSGYDEPRAQFERGRVAREAWRDPGAGSAPWLRRLHASHEPARGPFCLCMHRAEAATVSYTEVVVSCQAATMRYHDGPLCAAQRPTATLRLILQAACQESELKPTNQQLGDHHEHHPSPLQPTRRALLSSGLSTCDDNLELAD